MRRGLRRLIEWLAWFLLVLAWLGSERPRDPSPPFRVALMWLALAVGVLIAVFSGE